MKTESKTNEIHKEIALKGTKHPCFKGFILYDETIGAYLGKDTDLDVIQGNVFTYKLFSYKLDLNIVHVYKNYEEVFRVNSSLKPPTYIAQLFDINNELFCHFNV